MKTKNKRIIIPVIAVLFMVFGVQFLSAWGPTGHRIIAEIAERHLTPEAKQAVEKILGSKPLASIATWPDHIYSESEWNYAKKRHFITVNDDQTLEEVLKEKASDTKIDNVYEAVEYFSDILRGKKDKIKRFKDRVKKEGAKLYMDSIEASALSFLVHFTGDVHQPMHVGLGSDWGGNAIKVTWFDEGTNLHSLWDGGLLESEKLSYSEYIRFIDLASPGEIKKYQNSTLKQWTQESINLRKKIYKGLEGKIDSVKSERAETPDLSYQYAHDYIEDNNDRLLEGGIRLAGLLNSIFK